MPSSAGYTHCNESALEEASMRQCATVALIQCHCCLSQSSAVSHVMDCKLWGVSLRGIYTEWKIIDIENIVCGSDTGPHFQNLHIIYIVSTPCLHTSESIYTRGGPQHHTCFPKPCFPVYGYPAPANIRNCPDNVFCLMHVSVLFILKK